MEIVTCPKCKEVSISRNGFKKNGVEHKSELCFKCYEEAIKKDDKIIINLNGQIHMWEY